MNRGLKIVAMAMAAAFLMAALATYVRSTSAEAEGQLVGFVDSEMILATYAPAKEVNLALGALKKTSEDNLKKKVQEKYGAGDLSSLPEQDQMAVQKMIEEADAQYQKDMDKLREEKWTPIVKTVNDTIKQIADEQKITVVLDKGAVIYGGVDLTEGVTKKLTAK
ncbi:MAG: OmpH family outer membrane protein [bacterium]